MPWAIPADDLAMAIAGLHPVAAFVQQTSGDGNVPATVAAIRRMCAEMQEKRAHAHARVRNRITMLLEAEAEGWVFSVDGDLKTLREVHSMIDGERTKVARIHAAVVREASSRLTADELATLKSSLEISQDICNDIEDYISDVEEIAERMAKKDAKSSVIQRAERSYRAKFKDAMPDIKKISSRKEILDGSLVLRMIIHLPEKSIEDFDSILAAERTVHANVAEEDDVLVGRIAIEYQAAA